MLLMKRGWTEKTDMCTIKRIDISTVFLDGYVCDVVGQKDSLLRCGSDK